MNITVKPARLSGKIRAIPSKSQAHRALICAALADSETYIKCEGESRDITATIDCLSVLGASVTRVNEGFLVLPLSRSGSERRFADKSARNSTEEFSRFPCGKVLLPCQESGSTFRFLLPIVLALGVDATFELCGRLPHRPLYPLREELIAHGCKLSVQGESMFCATGKLTPGSYTINAGVSSQFISGLLFALPLLDDDSKIILTGRVESYPYIEMTVAMQDLFFVISNPGGACFSVPGEQKYRSPGELSIEGDWSNAAFWLCAGAMGASEITCEALNLKTRQGDRAVIDILKQFGANVKTRDDDLGAVTVSRGTLRGIEIDAADIPDLVPILAVVASAADGITKIYNAARLRAKESDRLMAVGSLLRGLGANARETDDGLVIEGGKPLMGGVISSFGDHRIAMAAAIAASTVCASAVTIEGAQAVEKSYPHFFDDLISLGGILTENKDGAK